MAVRSGGCPKSQTTQCHPATSGSDLLCDLHAPKSDHFFSFRSLGQGGVSSEGIEVSEAQIALALKRLNAAGSRRGPSGQGFCPCSTAGEKETKHDDEYCGSATDGQSLSERVGERDTA